MIICPFFQIAISVLSIPTIHIPLYPSLLLVLYSTHPLLLAVAKSISITAFLLAVHDSHLLYSSPIGCLYYIFLVPPLFVPYSYWLPLLYIPGSPLFVPYFYWLPLLYSIVLVPPVRPLLLLVASTINSSVRTLTPIGCVWHIISPQLLLNRLVATVCLKLALANSKLLLAITY